VSDARVHPNIARAANADMTSFLIAVSCMYRCAVDETGGRAAQSRSR